MPANTVTRFRDLLFETPNGCCAVAFQTYFAISTFHGNTNLQLGSGQQLTNIMSGIVHQVTVELIDAHGDLIIFRTLGQSLIIGIDCQLGQALLGDDCYQVGMSVLDAPTSAQKIYVDKGVISSTYIDPRGHSLASCGSNRGDSGGGCFSCGAGLPIQLFGLVVGNRTISISAETHLVEFFYPSRTVLIPAATIQISLRSVQVAAATMQTLTPVTPLPQSSDAGITLGSATLQSERNVTATEGIHHGVVGIVAAQILAENRDCNAGGMSGKRKRGGQGGFFAESGIPTAEDENQ